MTGIRPLGEFGPLVDGPLDPELRALPPLLSAPLTVSPVPAMLVAPLRAPWLTVEAGNEPGVKGTTGSGSWLADLLTVLVLLVLSGSPVR